MVSPSTKHFGPSGRSWCSPRGPDRRAGLDGGAGSRCGINVLGSVNVFAAAHAAGVRRVVNTSTGGAIYGKTDVVPTSEDVPADPVSAYGLSKLTAEHHARWFAECAGWTW
jgi:hypothetical protein